MNPTLFEGEMMQGREKSKRTKGTLGFAPPISRRDKRRVLRDGAAPNEERDRAFRRIILSIPPGKVSSYGKVAAAAGHPLYHRAVARLLRTDPPDQLPWHRVVGAGGAIKLPGSAAKEQRARLRMEGVDFRGERVNMDACEYVMRPWETFE